MKINLETSLSKIHEEELQESQNEIGPTSAQKLMPDTENNQNEEQKASDYVVTES